MGYEIIYVFMIKLTIYGHYLIQFINAESHKHFEVTEKLFAAGISVKVCCAETFERSQWLEYLATHRHIDNPSIHTLLEEREIDGFWQEPGTSYC